MVGDREDMALLNQCIELRDSLENYYHISIDGIWAYSEMLIVQLALQDLEAGLGGNTYFREEFNALHIIRHDSALGPNRGLSEVLYDNPSEINVYSDTFAYGESLARYILLHESEHIRDYRHDFSDTLTHQSTTQAEGGFYECETDPSGVCYAGYYTPGRGCFSDWACSAINPMEDTAESWAASMYGGDWGGLLAVDAANFDPTVRPSLAELRLNWVDEQIEALHVSLDSSNR